MGFYLKDMLSEKDTMIELPRKRQKLCGSDTKPLDVRNNLRLYTAVLLFKEEIIFAGLRLSGMSSDHLFHIQKNGTTVCLDILEFADSFGHELLVSHILNLLYLSKQ